MKTIVCVDEYFSSLCNLFKELIMNHRLKTKQDFLDLENYYISLGQKFPNFFDETVVWDDLYICYASIMLHGPESINSNDFIYDGIEHSFIDKFYEKNVDETEFNLLLKELKCKVRELKLLKDF